MCLDRQLSGQREIHFPPQKLFFPFQETQINVRGTHLILKRIAFITPG
jgi:hypothetical protein